MIWNNETKRRIERKKTILRMTEMKKKAANSYFNL